MSSMFSDVYNSGQTWLEAETFPQYSLRSNRQGFSQQERIGDAWPEKLVNIFWPKRLQLSTYLSKTLIVWQLIWKPDMKLVDAVIGLKICFEDENGKEINPKLGLMQPSGKKSLCLPMWLGIRGKETQGRDESSSFLRRHQSDDHLCEGDLPLKLIIWVLMSLLWMPETNGKNVETKLSRRLYLTRAWPLGTSGWWSMMAACGSPGRKDQFCDLA